jgi:DNA-binding transcriptional LysR family regulator
VELAQIEAFLVLCEELHFGRTAERLHVTQPRVSRLIASLESEVGAALAERTSRRVVLTPLGSRLRDALVPAYSQLNVALSNARAAARSPGPLRLGFTATTAGPPLDRLIMAFERARPDCTLSLKEVALADSYTPLRTGEIDVLVCWLVLDEPGLTPGPAIASYGRVLAIADDHPLAGEKSTSVEVLADYAVPNWEFDGLAVRVREAMVPSRTPSGRPVLVHPTPVRTVSEAVSLIARKQAVLPTVSLQRFDNHRIVLVPIRDLPPVPLGLVWWTANENARIRALAQVASDLQHSAAGADLRVPRAIVNTWDR